MTRPAALQDRLGYTFKNQDLLTLALTHRSVADGPAAAPGTNNERLEFLGDRVLGLAIGHLLLDTFPEEPEGSLARRLAALVSAQFLEQVAGKLELANDVQAGRGETVAGAILSDACEAVIGAIYLDGGFPAAQAVIRRHWKPLVDTAEAPPIDAKTALQEWLQSQGRPLPRYKQMERSGPDHAPHFIMAVLVDGEDPCEGEGPSKQAAMQEAAATMLERLT